MVNVSIFFKDIKPIDLVKKNITKLSELIFNDFNYSRIELNIVLTTDEQLSDMKKEYFNLDQYTDVIAFTINDKVPAIEGELYVSIDRVRENATTFNASIDKELKRVISHGVLHLVGLDDSSSAEKKEMTKYEDRYINSVGTIIG
tara:strand:+ start:1012 stop:1446 length:435 start_codon:yes stop_codon:yes gene_type:complete